METVTFENSGPDYARFDQGTGCEVRQTEYFKHQIPILQEETSRTLSPVDPLPAVFPEKVAESRVVKGDRSSEKRPIDEAFEASLRVVESKFRYDSDMDLDSDEENQRARKKRNISGSNNNPCKCSERYTCVVEFITVHQRLALVCSTALPRIRERAKAAAAAAEGGR